MVKYSCVKEYLLLSLCLTVNNGRKTVVVFIDPVVQT